MSSRVCIAESVPPLCHEALLSLRALPRLPATRASFPPLKFLEDESDSGKGSVSFLAHLIPKLIMERFNVSHGCQFGNPMIDR